MEGEDETYGRHFSEDHQSPTVLPWDQFSNWIHCCCVVTFDLELGQAMEVIVCFNLVNVRSVSSRDSVVVLNARTRNRLPRSAHKKGDHKTGNTEKC